MAMLDPNSPKLSLDDALGQADAVAQALDHLIADTDRELKSRDREMRTGVSDGLPLSALVYLAGEVRGHLQDAQEAFQAQTTGDRGKDAA